jgi:virginiamycin B lyase
MVMLDRRIATARSLLVLALSPILTAALLVATVRAADPLPSAEPDSLSTPLPSGRSWIVETFAVSAGAGPHDVAPAPDGTVWYTGQGDGTLGRLDPLTGAVTAIPLGPGSRPHGVIVGPDGAPWVTDGGQNAIVRVDPGSHEVTVHPLPPERAGANLNTAAFDAGGILWFTGQAGIVGRLDPSTGELAVRDAPEGRGPYGIAATPTGEVWYVSLAGSYLARIDGSTGDPVIVEPPTPEQGARRVWSDSAGRLWIAEWNAGQVGRYDPGTDEWAEWRLPGDDPAAYAVYVDDRDIVWLTDFGANAIVRFDPASETFTTLGLPGPEAAVRQLLGRPGELWGAASALDLLVRVRTDESSGMVGHRA